MRAHRQPSKCACEPLEFARQAESGKAALHQHAAVSKTGLRCIMHKTMLMATYLLEDIGTSI